MQIEPALILARVHLEARTRRASGAERERLYQLLAAKCFGCYSDLSTPQEVAAGCLCRDCQQRKPWRCN